MFDFLSRMGFHDLNPQRMGDLQPPSPGDLLDGDGGNLASVIARMRANAPHRLERIERYLSAVVPGMVGVRQRELGPMLTLEFRQRVRGDGHPWRFLAASVSNGTLHALGVLTALFQGDPGSVGVVGIEEPESGLHPAAAEVLMDALSEASERCQVLAATHSADLLDVPEIATASLRAVVMEEGVTRVALLDEAGRGILREGLATPGELLRLGHLAPAPDPSAPLSCGPGGGTDPVRRARIN